MLLGYANMIIFKCQAYSVFRIITLDFWISPAIEHRQIIFLFDSTTKPIGYITWAHLAPDAEHRLLKDPSFLLHPSEWNEGGRTWIIDFCFPYGRLKESIKKLKVLFQNENINKIHWARRNPDYTIRKVGNHHIY